MEKSKIRVLASLSDFGVSQKEERGVVQGQGEPPGSVLQMGPALQRFSQRMGVSLDGAAAEIASSSIERSAALRTPTPRSSTSELGL